LFGEELAKRIPTSNELLTECVLLTTLMRLSDLTQALMLLWHILTAN